MKRLSLSLLMLIAGPASATPRLALSIASPVFDGTPVAVEREILGATEQVVYVTQPGSTKPQQRMGSYTVHLACAGAHPFTKDLVSRPSPSGPVNEEHVLLLMTENSDTDCTVTILDRSHYPSRHIFQGLVGSIPRAVD